MWPQFFLKNYLVFSSWDTFWAFNALMTIILPEKADKWEDRWLVQKYREGGLLPKWPLASNYTGKMVGSRQIRQWHRPLPKDWLQMKI